MILQAYDSEQEPSDVVSWILRATKDKDAPAVPTRRALTEDTRSVVIAGRYVIHSQILSLIADGNYAATRPLLHSQTSCSISPKIPTVNAK